MHVIKHASPLLCGMTIGCATVRWGARAIVAETLLPIPKTIQCNNKIIAPMRNQGMVGKSFGFVAIKSGTSYDDHWLWWCFDFNQAIDAHPRIALRHAGTCLDSRAGHHCTLGHCMMLQHAHILWHNIGWDACFKLLQVWRLGPAPSIKPALKLWWPGPAPSINPLANSIVAGPCCAAYRCRCRI